MSLKTLLEKCYYYASTVKSVEIVATTIYAKNLYQKIVE